MSSRRPQRPRQESDTPHYQTFPTTPPTSKGLPPPREDPRQPSSTSNRPRSGSSDRSPSQGRSPLPKKQLIVLAVISLCEQTAFNSISPYLPDMASSFPDIKKSEVGLYVGLIASAFASAQFMTNFFWGWLSDRVGRKPVILMGTIMTAACFTAFGFCETLWQAITVQIFMGLVNGNQGVVSTCLGEITDRSNQSTAFTYLPVVYGIGGITGPIVGGFLAKQKQSVFGFATSTKDSYPYLAPNLLCAAVLILDLFITMIFLDESLEEAQSLPPLGKRVGNLFAWLWQFSSSTRPSYVKKRPHRRSTGLSSTTNAQNSERAHEDEAISDTASQQSAPPVFVQSEQHQLRAKDVLNRDILLILITYFIFQLSNIAYNSLYPIFAQASPPTGRDLSPKEIGISLGFAGLVTIVFQVGIFGKMRDKIGNKTTYRVGLGGFVVAFLLMPWVGYKNADGIGLGKGKGWLWAELGVVLVIKTVATVGGLTSALLLITNSAPNHSVLGTLNGLAQTLSAAGRAVGPFISGSLFTAAIHIRPKGEAMAFGIFGGIALIGFLMSFGIRGLKLETEDWEDEEQSSGEEGYITEEEADEGTAVSPERQPLLNGKK